MKFGTLSWIPKRNLVNKQLRSASVVESFIWVVNSVEGRIVIFPSVAKIMSPSVSGLITLSARRQTYHHLCFLRSCDSAKRNINGGYHHQCSVLERRLTEAQQWNQLGSSVRTAKNGREIRQYQMQRWRRGGSAENHSEERKRLARHLQNPQRLVADERRMGENRPGRCC